MVGSEARGRFPIGQHNLVPLVIERLAKIEWPGAGDPIGRTVVWSTTRATREGNDAVDAQFFGHQDSIGDIGAMRRTDLGVGMQRVGVGAQRADRQAPLIDSIFQSRSGVVILQQFCRFAIAVTHIATTGDLDGLHTHRLNIVQHLIKRDIAKHSNENADFHLIAPNLDKPAPKLNAKTPRCKGAEKKLGVVAALCLCVEFFAFYSNFQLLKY